MNQSSILPMPRSPVSLEQSAEPDLADRLLDACFQGNLLLESAIDHAYALTLLMVEPMPTVAPWTCVRGGLEAAAAACWLLSDDIDGRERVSRSLAFRYDGLREQQKLARAAGDLAVMQQVDERIEELEQKALVLGFSPTVDRNGKRNGIGQKMPLKTECIETVFGAETLYRILSGMAHSQPNVMIQLGYQPFDPSVPTLLQKATPASAAMVLLITGADVVARPSWMKAILYGLDTRRLSRILEARYDEMGVSESLFFWRHAS